MKQELSIPEWHEMALSGISLPMRILIHGASMFPLIRMDRDYVTIMPATGEIKAGDIVLFSDPAAKRYVLHRVWRIEGDKILTWGDNCTSPDSWMPMTAVWGRAILIERGKRQICPDPAKGLRLARIWHRTGNFYRFCRRIASGVRRRIMPEKAKA